MSRLTRSQRVAVWNLAEAERADNDEWRKQSRGALMARRIARRAAPADSVVVISLDDPDGAAYLGAVNRLATARPDPMELRVGVIDAMRAVRDERPYLGCGGAPVRFGRPVPLP